jgi:hypothetical protein
MALHPKALLATALFVAALVLAMNVRFGATASVLAVVALVAYFWIESLGMGLGPRGSRKTSLLKSGPPRDPPMPLL